MIVRAKKIQKRFRKVANNPAKFRKIGLTFYDAHHFLWYGEAFCPE
jgi:hypothetical protein